MLEEAVLEVLSTYDEKSNAEVTKSLGLESDQDGKQKDYLAYSVLGRLMKQGLVRELGKGDDKPNVGYVKLA